MKTILSAAKMLTKTEQRSIKGGSNTAPCYFECKNTGERTLGSYCSLPSCGGCIRICN